MSRDCFAQIGIHGPEVHSRRRQPEPKNVGAEESGRTATRPRHSRVRHCVLREKPECWADDMVMELRKNWQIPITDQSIGSPSPAKRSTDAAQLNASVRRPPCRKRRKKSNPPRCYEIVTTSIRRCGGKADVRCQRFNNLRLACFESRTDLPERTVP
jgi:hypothetical protein